jgi:nucleoside-diphosphate-sugar epimerase
VTRCLVLGPHGFLGTQVRRAVAGSGLTLVSASARPAPIVGDEEWHLLGKDEHDLAGLRSLLQRVAPHVVINCAGRTTGNASELTASNVSLVAALVGAMSTSDTAPRLVHLGSAAEYGAATGQEPVSELTPCRPMTAYGATKLAGTQLVAAAAEDGRLEAVVLRVFNPIGEAAPATTLAGRAAGQIRAAMDNGRTDIQMGPLGDARDFIDVGDVAEAVVAAVAAPARSAVLNIGSGRATSVRQLLRVLATVAGWSGTFVETAADTPRLQQIPWQEADVSAAADELRWRASTSLERSLEQLWSTATAS